MIGCLTVTCIFIGFARLPVGDAATIIFCSPIFVMIFSHVILREHCGLYRFIFINTIHSQIITWSLIIIYYRFYVIGLLLVGVVLIAKPPFLLKILFPHDNTLVTQVN